MKQFAFPLSIKCASIEERDECVKLLESIGYIKDMYNNFGFVIVSNIGGYNGMFSDVNLLDRYNYNRHHIDHFNPELIRDIASACTNDTWQDGEIYVFGSTYRVHDGSLVGTKITAFRRPTLAEICEHHGYKVVGSDILKKEEKISNCDKSYCETARQLDEAKAEIKRIKEKLEALTDVDNHELYRLREENAKLKAENVKLSDMTLYATREMNKYNELYNSVSNREGIVKQLIRDIASELDMDLD